MATTSTMAFGKQLSGKSYLVMRAREHKDRYAIAVLSCLFNILTSSMNSAKSHQRKSIYNYGSMGCYGNALGKQILK